MDYRRRYSYGTEEDECEKEEIRGVSSGDNRSAAKRGTPYTRGTAMSFGFRRRPTSGIPMPVTGSFSSEVGGSLSSHGRRSKSAGHESDRSVRRNDEESNYRGHNNASSGRSTPRLAPPKKEATGTSVRTNRFGFRQPQPLRYTDKVGDVCASHNGSHYNNHEKTTGADSNFHGKLQTNRRVYTTTNNAPVVSKLRPSPVGSPYNHNNNTLGGGNEAQRSSYGQEPISKYTLHTSHLPQPQFAVRMNNDSNSKTAKTAANQSRKISTVSKCTSSSKEGSGTEDSGIGSQFGCLGDESGGQARTVDYLDNSGGSPTIGRRGGSGGGGGGGGGGQHVRPRNLRMVVNGKSFDVRDVHDDSTVTEISVITLPKLFANVNLNTGLVRERTSHYQRVINKDNRYNDSVSITSSEGYDEGLGEEKGYKDRSRYEKVPSVKSDFSPPSSDDPEYGHGEAMADEYSFSSSEECRANYNNAEMKKAMIIAASSQGKIAQNQVPKTNLRSVLLTIEDPAFAAAAATATTMIDDETSPVDSLFDSPTASITQSDGKVSRKENVMEKSGNTIDDDSPGTPTNASNSLSLSEGREFFDDEIADQPGLTFDETVRVGHELQQTGIVNNQVNENSYTLVESHPKTAARVHGKSVESSPMHGRRISRAGSVDTLSPCESIASDDLMLDYERSDASSYEESTHRLDSNTALHEMDDATILSELEAQGEEVMREWSCLLGAHHSIQQTHSNSNNNNLNANNNNNHNNTTESGIGSGRTSRLLRSRSGTDSPRSLDSVRSRQVSSPLRPPRNIQSPSLDSGDEGSLKLERGTYQYMFQDIVSIKTMLLKLKRVLQESEENGLTRAETLNPFDNTMKNGLFYNLNENGTTEASTSPGSDASSVADELADLRRQVVFLQGQLEDRDRTVHLLQVQMTKYQGINGVDSQCSASSSCNSNDISKETSNAATQTDKVRPVSAGPLLLQSLPQDGNAGPLVSHVGWSDLWNQPHPPAPTVLNGFRTLRKPSDHSPRLLRSRQDSARNDHLDKPIAESSPIKKLQKSKELGQKRSLDVNSTAAVAQTKPETTSTKSSIPMPRRLTTQTLIPRAARAVSATGRSHNP
ncbi:uncharacterized protein LOC107220946 isoform X3 [Neodiprion lecontei]|uniref:Uncharacterized protein LOC107220946 isoform X3 n=1 Tax=Neodiprion lecontei TaxID=441921 RepID=A0ABM3GN46_NEOLC|nr:uncharacterized protein LOC107220946 isoform X3 [Neodiprion lecontei]